MPSNQDPARACADEIWRDGLNRHGIKWEYEQVEDDVREEIMATWSDIIRRHFPEGAGEELTEAGKDYVRRTTDALRVPQGRLEELARKLPAPESWLEDESDDAATPQPPPAPRRWCRQYCALR